MAEQLSPAAQAVIDAWWHTFDGKYIDGVWTPNRSAQLAAALQAVADQVVPEHKPWLRTDGEPAARHKVRLELLAIAAELKAQ